MKEFVYLDNAATTKVRPEVVEAMLPYFTEIYGNASAVYDFGQKCKQAMEDARETIAASIGTKAANIYFTAGGSESDNWALKGVAEAYGDKGKHIITTKIEHHAILHTCAYLEQQGYEVTYLDVDADGLVSPEALRQAIRPDTILISVMFANNEIGTMQPIAEIGRLAKEKGILFHTDECKWTQIKWTKGNWLFIYPTGLKIEVVYSWRCTGKKTPCRNRKCTGDCRSW